MDKQDGVSTKIVPVTHGVEYRVELGPGVATFGVAPRDENTPMIACVDIEGGTRLIYCECGGLRPEDRPHAWRRP